MDSSEGDRKPRAKASKTLDRGLSVLDALAAAPGGLSMTAIAAQLGIHRTSAYRLLGTLCERRLASVSADGRYHLGVRLLELAASVAADLRSLAVPELSELANDVGATAFLAVLDGTDAVAVSVIEPRRTRMHVAYRVGSRHPADIGADGLAILAGRPWREGERKPVSAARAAGFASSAGELQTGAYGIAAPVIRRDRPAEASVGVVAMHALDVAAVAPRVIQAALRVGRALDW
ncbi:MAG TPA: IclR family transcriptional regulator [Gammaproteobacteria bacterium]|nr:IclR family transcriptional regulator [Gammaproteobacteria bacterium]